MVKTNSLAISIGNPTVYVGSLAAAYFWAFFVNQEDNDFGDLDPDIVPPSYAFRIWILIFSWLGIYSIYSALGPTVPQNKNLELNYDSDKGVGFWFMIVVVLINAWIIVATVKTRTNIFLLELIIFAALVISFICYNRFQRIRRSVELNIWEQLIYPCFSILTGWLLAANFLQLAIFLNSQGFTYDQFGFQSYDDFQIFLLCVYFGIASAITWYEQEPIVGYVLCWACGTLSGKLYNDRIFKVTFTLAVLQFIESSFVLGYYYMPRVLKNTPVIPMGSSHEQLFNATIKKFIEEPHLAATQQVILVLPSESKSEE